MSLSDLVEVTLIYDAALGSPADTQQHNGKVVAVDREQIPLPREGTFLGLPGLGRQATVNSVVRWEWVMLSATPGDVLDQFLDGLTGRADWTVPASRATVRTVVLALLSRGFTRSQININMPQLYAAIAAEVRAEDAL
jgi:hypothetical protein